MALPELTRIREAAGPFVTLYLPTRRNQEQAAAAFDTLWRDVMHDLEAAGVDEATRQALEQARGDHADGATLVFVAANGEVLLRRGVPDELASARPIVEVSPLPYVLPLLTAYQGRLPHVVVLADHAGAEVTTYADEVEPVTDGTVTPARGVLHKTGTGGWSARRYDLGVENTWALTAKRIAEAVEAGVKAVDAKLICLGGDEKETSLVLDKLPETLRGLVVPISGNRHTDGGDEAMRASIDAVVREQVAALQSEALERFATYRGRARKDAVTPLTDDEGNHELALNAAEGLPAVVEALRRAQVGTLLVSAAETTGVTGTAGVTAQNKDVVPQSLWVGPGPLELGLTRDELTALGVTEPVAADAVSALIRAALGGDADVVVLTQADSGALTDGVGALLRYSAPADQVVQAV